jgi:hypothetical protein
MSLFTFENIQKTQNIRINKFSCCGGDTDARYALIMKLSLFIITIFLYDWYKQTKILI